MKIHFIFRADQSNVGDWWCPPFRYFNFRPASVSDIYCLSDNLSDDDILIIGGGGLGTEHFTPYLNFIKAKFQGTSIIWGAGIDTIVDKSGLLSAGEYDLYGDFFKGFTEVSTRVFTSPLEHRYTPCSSCMHPSFDRYRELKPTSLIGVYQHKRVHITLDSSYSWVPTMDNSGSNIDEKLHFLSKFEYIITNTYHGVYWGTLLGRKIICLPFKSGLFSFKDTPQYCFDGHLSDDVFLNAKSYDFALEDARLENISFYRYLTSKYDLV